MAWDYDSQRMVYRHTSGFEVTRQAWQEMSEGQRLEAVADMAFKRGKEQAMALGGDLNNFNYAAGTTNITYPPINTASGNTFPMTIGASPPKRWHNFPCGHQVELEGSQPVPMACTVCGPVKAPEYEHHTYPKCGHAFSFPKGGYLPPSCGVCVADEQRLAKEREAAETLKAEARARREAEDREPLAWLDKQVGDLTAAGVV